METMQYVCDVCGYHRPRLRSVQDHCVTRKAKDSHPAGADTPISRRMMPPAFACRCRGCCPDRSETKQPAATVVMAKEDDASVAVSDFSRLLAALNAAAHKLNRVVPAHHFLREPIPGLRGLHAKLVDVFAGNVAGHLVWTHIHACSNVRASGRAGHVRVFGVHGWNTVSVEKAASASVAAFPARLERMWLALKEHDPRLSTVLRPAMLSFAQSGLTPMDADVFEFHGTRGRDARDGGTLVSDVAASFEEYAVSW